MARTRRAPAGLERSSAIRIGHRKSSEPQVAANESLSGANEGRSIGNVCHAEVAKIPATPDSQRLRAGLLPLGPANWAGGSYRTAGWGEASSDDPCSLGDIVLAECPPYPHSPPRQHRRREVRAIHLREEPGGTHPGNPRVSRPHGDDASLGQEPGRALRPRSLLPHPRFALRRSSTRCTGSSSDHIGLRISWQSP